MNSGDDDVLRAVSEHSNAAAEMLERALLDAVGTVERELARVMLKSESDLERLAGLAVQMLAKLAEAGAASSHDERGAADTAGSLNQIATAVARAARRGARFT